MRIRSASMTSGLIFVLLLTVVWQLLGANVISIAFLGALTIVLTISAYLEIIPSKIPIYIFKACSYFLWLVLEIVKSSFQVAKTAWDPEYTLKPTMIWIDSVQTNECGILIFANSITLTPGTVTVETSKNQLLIHAIDIDNIRSLHEMDRKVQRIIKC